MAIATVERDPARSSSASEPRFKLLQELCRTGDLQYWRATDRRSGKPCVVRVLEAGREESSRRLGELHRERLLAERIGHAAVLRPDVPLIEGERIFQGVQPEPARRIESVQDEGRLAVLQMLAGVAATVAEAHARGGFHGALTRDSLLRSAEGRVIVQGFSGDAGSAAVARDGAAADHHAFLMLAEELLAPSGGPPPRLRRYFARELTPGAARPPANAMSTLADELRESLEDTFPWPTKPGASLDTASTSPLPVLAEKATPVRVAPAARVPERRQPRVAEIAKSRPEPAAVPDAPLLAVPDTTSAAAATVAPPARCESAPNLAPTIVATVAVPASSEPSTAVQAVQAVQAARPALQLSDIPAALEPYAQAVPSEPRPSPANTAKPSRAREEKARVSPAHFEAAEPPRAPRSLRPWLAAALIVGAVLAAWQYGQHRHRVDVEQPAAAAPRAARAPGPAMAEPSATATATANGHETPASTSVTVPDPAAAIRARSTPSTRPASVDSPAPPQRPARPVMSVEAPTPTVRALPEASRPAATDIAQRTPPMPAATAAAKAAANAAATAAATQLDRSRVANLVAGGNRALNALEPALAATAFAQALALAPGDSGAMAGSQRARRLLGAAALVRDAREAAARGDQARAVQGYSQALANDPRNRGLAEALSASRRALARDATGTLLASGHEALGAGRLEEARDAFERALELDPRAPGARRAAEQAATAILLRDSATERRLAANPP